MPGIACVDVDQAGGVQLGGGQSIFRVRGNLVVVLGDAVEPHFPFTPPHAPAPYMAEATSRFRICGIPVCRAGHAADCGHTTSGRAFFKIP